MTETRIGFIGAGAVAARHARMLLGFPDVRISGVADPQGDRAEALAHRCDARAYRDPERMLEREPLDAVYICVPPFAHGRPERAVLEAGLPFFVEKPLALDLATAEEMGALVAASGVVTASGYHWRYLDTLERAKQMLAAAPARMLVARWLDKVPPPPWWVRRDLSGGQTIEQTTHVLDVLRALGGEVEEVWAVEARADRAAFPHADVPDVTAGALRFRSGAVGSLASTCLLSGKLGAGVEVFAEGLAMTLTEEEMEIVRGQEHERHRASGDAKHRVDREFVDAVRGEANTVRAPYAEALETHRLACALVRSARENRPVTLTPAAV